MEGNLDVVNGVYGESEAADRDGTDGWHDAKRAGL